MRRTLCPCWCADALDRKRLQLGALLEDVRIRPIALAYAGEVFAYQRVAFVEDVRPVRRADILGAQPVARTEVRGIFAGAVVGLSHFVTDWIAANRLCAVTPTGRPMSDRRASRV